MSSIISRSMGSGFIYELIASTFLLNYSVIAGRPVSAVSRAHGGLDQYGVI